MKTAAKVFVLFTLLLAHKALAAQETKEFTIDKIVQIVNSSVSGWLTQTPRS